MGCAKQDGLIEMNELPVLELRNLSVEYMSAFRRTPAVRSLSLTIHEGEVYGLVGESGCGKTTAALACVRYLPAGARIGGEILFLGDNVLTLGPRELRRIRGNRIAMVYQDPQTALNPSLPVEAQMAEILTTHEHVSASVARARCLEMLERVRIADPGLVLRRYPHQLSGGMQQRVLIAMALLLKPSLLIMDEPTTGLDVTVEAAVLDLVNDLRRAMNTAILFISHNMGVIARMCDRVGVMYAGEMVEEAPVRDLFKSPRHPYTVALLRCVPHAGGSKRDYALSGIPGRVPPLHALPPGCVFASRCPMARAECLEQAPPLAQLPSGRRSRCLFWHQVEQTTLERQPAPQTWGGDFRGEGAFSVPNLLTVEELRVHFRQRGGFFSAGSAKRTVRAVDGVTFYLPSRSTLGIVGESGCGKSTIARAVAGLTPILSGRIRFEDKDLSAPVRRRPADLLQSLQMVFQNPDSTLNPQKTVEEEIRRPLRLFRVVPRDQEDQAVSLLLQAVNLDDTYRTRYPAQLSGGEKQRVAIARAFAGRPRLVLCDEPASSLDVSVQAMVLNLLLRLQQEYGVSLVFISHDLSVVRYLSDYVAVIYLGRVVEIGRAEKVFSPPYHPYTEALLSAIPIPDPTVRRPQIRLEGTVPSPTSPPPGCRFHTRCPRKIGRVCEETEPPAAERDGHLIYCHIPLAELEQTQMALFT
mgnify:CR=1 FL=1